MPDEVRITAKGTCQFEKNTGELCKRSVSASETMCWQHAHSWPHKWKSLTRNQTVSFIGLLVSLVIGVAGLFPSHFSFRTERMPKSIVKTPFEAANAPTKNAPTTGTTGVMELTPYVVIHRRENKFDGQVVKGTDYGLRAMLRVHNLTSAPEYIRSLEVVGDVAANCDEYEDAFGVADGTHTDGYLDDECKQRKPLYRLSWVTYPINSGRVDANGDEEFIRFNLLEPSTAVRLMGADHKRYFWFNEMHATPALLTTAPYLFDLVTFTRFSSGYPVEMQGFKLRDEIISGKVKFRILVNNDEVTLRPQNIHSVGWTIDSIWDKATSQDLFFGTTEIDDRTTPFVHDPAMQIPK
jgi:hypothetical protein